VSKLHFFTALLWLGCSLSAMAELGDPMRPAPGRGDAFAADGSARGVLHLTATMLGPDSGLAIINGQRVHLGEKVLGARVVQIRPGKVMLQRDGETQTLWVNATRVKSSATRNKKTSP